MFIHATFIAPLSNNKKTAKGGFLSESAICFSISKKKKIQKTILNLKFKLQVQDSFSE